jgi:hypothetical protein
MMNQARQIAHMGETKNAYEVFAGKYQRNRFLMKYSWSIWTGFTLVRINTCESSNETSSSRNFQST